MFFIEIISRPGHSTGCGNESEVHPWHKHKQIYMFYYSNTYLNHNPNSISCVCRFQEQAAPVQQMQLPQGQQLSPVERENFNRATIDTLIHSHKTNPSVSKNQNWYQHAQIITRKKYNIIFPYTKLNGIHF